MTEYALFPLIPQKRVIEMRKLINKKGFSLVELMIVVVIMGILIAVAIPLYGSITENAERKTCGSNQSLIREMFAKYCVMDSDNTSATLLPDGEFSSKDGNTDGIAPEFIASFDEKFPECPLDGHYYVIKTVPGEEYSIDIKCHDANGNVVASHT